MQPPLLRFLNPCSLPNSPLQFYYGEDGIDPCQTGCLKTFPFLFYNSPQFAVQLEAAAALDFPRTPEQEAAERRAREAVRYGTCAVGSCREEAGCVQEKCLRHHQMLLCLLSRATDIPCCCRERAQLLMSDARPASARADTTLPLNAQLPQTTLGVTSEGFQDALTTAIFGGGMLPPNPGGVEAAYREQDKALRKAAAAAAAAGKGQGKDVVQGGKAAAAGGTSFKYLDHMGAPEMRAGG